MISPWRHFGQHSAAGRLLGRRRRGGLEVDHTGAPLWWSGVCLQPDTLPGPSVLFVNRLLSLFPSELLHRAHPSDSSFPCFVYCTCSGEMNDFSGDSSARFVGLGSVSTSLMGQRGVPHFFALCFLWSLHLLRAPFGETRPGRRRPLAVRPLLLMPWPTTNEQATDLFFPPQPRSRRKKGDRHLLVSVIVLFPSSVIFQSSFRLFLTCATEKTI